MENSQTLHEAKVLKTEKWLDLQEIHKLLSNVEYIISAQPNLDETSASRIHFTVFFNTHEAIPQDFIQPVLDKFVGDNELKDVQGFIARLGDVAFAKTSEETPLPYFIAHDVPIEDQDSQEMTTKIKLFIFDFKANAKQGFEEVTKGLTGWSYVYK